MLTDRGVYRAADRPADQRGGGEKKKKRTGSAWLGYSGEKSLTRLRRPMNIDAAAIRVNLHGERVNLKLKLAGEIA